MGNLTNVCKKSSSFKYLPCGRVFAAVLALVKLIKSKLARDSYRVFVLLNQYRYSHRSKYSECEHQIQ
jgi:hypothetical protein